MLEIILFFTISAYISVSFKAYISFKSAGLLGNGEKSIRYYMYVFFWPAYTNPFKQIAESIFKHYGEEGHIYRGWGGLMNFYNDLVKGKKRYIDYAQFKFNLELPESPEPIFTKLKYASINIAKKGDSILYLCHLSESPMEEKAISNYDFDKCNPIDHQHLIDKLQQMKVNYKDIENITHVINKKDSSHASV